MLLALENERDYVFASDVLNNHKIYPRKRLPKTLSG
jgi:hypothetical protein